MTKHSISIKSPFLTAGRIYHWPYKPVGVGINEIEFRGEGDIELTIGRNHQIYTIGKKEAIEFVKKYKAVHMAGFVKLGVIPLDLLKKKDDQPKLEI